MFYHPYTKIEYVEKNLLVSRQTASRYLERIVALGLLQKQRKGKENYYWWNCLWRIMIIPDIPKQIV